MRETVLRLEGWVTGAASAVACALLAAISVLGLWQVVTRFVFNQPSSWTEEAMRRMLVWCVMLGIVLAFRRGALVSVDLALRTSTGKWRTAIRSFITGSALAYLGVLLWFGLDLTWRVRFQSFAALELSMAWAYAALPVGALLCMLAVVANHLDPIYEELDNAQ
jgi:TRAP-type C4-dicarboxylate transport system permease small subunit